MIIRMENIFRFCPRCKSSLRIEGNRVLTCPSCGFSYYLNPAPCNAAILLNSKNELLLVRRKYEPKKGLLDLPGGFLDLGETAEESMGREIKEELGSEITGLRYFGSFYDVYIYKGISYNTVSFVYEGKLSKKVISPHDDISELVYVPLKTIPFDMLAFDSVIKALKRYVSVHI